MHTEFAVTAHWNGGFEERALQAWAAQVRGRLHAPQVSLGLLFLTDLKGYDIVLGKLAATSLNTFYGMLAIFPVLAISLLVGGVSGGEFWRMVLVSVNNLLFSLAVGIVCSAISRDERKAENFAGSASQDQRSNRRQVEDQSGGLAQCGAERRARMAAAADA